MQLMPKKWSVFQHYKDRCPPWIKLHRDLLNDRAFISLSTASKALAPLMWLLASEHKDGIFDASTDELEFRTRMSPAEISKAVKELISKGFFVVASGLLADCEQDAIPETETETETETDIPALPASVDAVCKLAEVVDVYHEVLTGLPKVRMLDKKRQTALNSRQREYPKSRHLDWWRAFFELAGDSNFLMGESGERSWKADFDFLTSPKGFKGVIEGKYQ